MIRTDERADTAVRLRGDLGLVLLIAVSTPTALLAESLVRRFLPPEFEELRAWLRPEATLVAWALAGFAVAASILGVALQRRLFRGAMARQRSGDDAYRLKHARIQTLAIGTSIPQVPALLATVACLFGAELGATLAAIGAATVGVAVQGSGLRRGGALDARGASDAQPSGG